ncbi:DUF4369 domain-containing protein [Emticicia sp. BO119]|uniref:DUF4369 domain-containing protein n=1 Tax=Emticicia sp. BO119 TaxID=2757768 RepID=UPI0015F0661B|nr:DUF4369 domain-containing protein [Emticicia sp. BO119]MBA4849218.1 DUF4369 domain-containing protein [Emticicia sp. BO119]
MNFLKIITFVCLSFSVFSQISFQIKGKVNGIESQTVLLITSENDTVASANVTGTAFRLKGKIGEPQLCYLQDSKRNFRLPVFIEQGSTSVSIELNPETNKIMKAIIKGAPEHDLYQKLLSSEKGHLTNDEVRQMQNWLKLNDTVSINHLKRVKRQEMDEAYENIRTIFASNPCSYACGFYIGSIRNIGKERLTKMYDLYNLLSPEIQRSHFGQKFYNQYQKESLKQ